MPDGYVVLENQRALVLHHVTDTTILDVRVAADTNVVNVATDDRVEPDAGVIPDLDVPDHVGAGGDEYARAQLRNDSLVLVQHSRNRFENGLKASETPSTGAMTANLLVSQKGRTVSI